jgi:hypothetical protein
MNLDRFDVLVNDAGFLTFEGCRDGNYVLAHEDHPVGIRCEIILWNAGTDIAFWSEKRDPKGHWVRSSSNTL